MPVAHEDVTVVQVGVDQRRPELVGGHVAEVHVERPLQRRRGGRGNLRDHHAARCLEHVERFLLGVLVRQPRGNVRWGSQCVQAPEERRQLAEERAALRADVRSGQGFSSQVAVGRIAVWSRVRSPDRDEVARDGTREPLAGVVEELDLVLQLDRAALILGKLEDDVVVDEVDTRRPALAERDDLLDCEVSLLVLDGAPLGFAHRWCLPRSA